jgi:hypothetical protein
MSRKFFLETAFRISVAYDSYPVALPGSCGIARLPNLFGSLSPPVLRSAPADRCRLLGPRRSPPLSGDVCLAEAGPFLCWAADVPGFCWVCGRSTGADRGWPPPVSRNSLRKPGSRPLLGSTAATFLGRSETKSDDFLCQTFEVLLSLIFNRRSSPFRGVPPTPWSTGFCSAAPHVGSEPVPLLEPQNAELSFSKFIPVLSISGPTVKGVL